MRLRRAQEGRGLRLLTGAREQGLRAGGLARMRRRWERIVCVETDSAEPAGRA